MEKAISETERRRKIQQDYNDEHGITPQTIKKAVRDLISISKAAEPGDASGKLKVDYESMSIKELERLRRRLRRTCVRQQQSLTLRRLHSFVTR